MFDLQLTASEPDASDSGNANLIQDTLRQVKVWLRSHPTPSSLYANLPALELALAAHLKNQDTELFALVRDALARLNQNVEPTQLSLEGLAALILLNLRTDQRIGTTEFQSAAQGLLAEGLARFDSQLEYLKASVSDNSQVFHAEGNAKLGEAFYLAWRVLDDQALRSPAGDVLGQVSTLFDPLFHLYREALPPTNGNESQRLSTIAAAIQLFLTASETTGRATYIIRACFLADSFLRQTDTEGSVTQDRVALARALNRLEQFTSKPEYRRAAQDILKAIRESNPPQGLDAASYALAVQEWEQFPLHIVIISNKEDDENANAMWRAALNEYASTRAIELLDPTRHTARIKTLGYAVAHDSALAYICIGPVCLPPVRSAQDLQRAVERAGML
ncbi:MAG TPA: hypothetical protein VFD70_29160 [Anaerolineae bacterium]|nr:hypothetical protein [Anaerolineae bacterium]